MSHLRCASASPTRRSPALSPELLPPGYDQIAQGEAGLMSLTGPGPDEPTKVGVPIGDILAGMYGAYGVVTALHERHATGRGRVVRTSLLASLVGVHTFQGTRQSIAGEVPRAIGNHHAAIAPYGLFGTADAPVQVAVGSESLWRRFAPAVGLDAEDPRFASNESRVAHRDDLVAEIETVSPPRAASTGWVAWTRRGCPPARSGPSTTSMPGSRPAPRAS